MHRLSVPNARKVLWHACGVVLIVMLPSLLRLGIPYWELREGLRPQVLAFGVGYLQAVLFLAFVGTKWPAKRIGAGRVLGALFVTIVSFAESLLLVVVFPGFDYSRLMILIGITLGFALAVSPNFLDRRAMSIMLLVLVSGVAASLGWAFESRARLSRELIADTRHRRTDYVGTNRYNLLVDYHNEIVKEEWPPGGGIVRHGQGFVVSSGRGEFFSVRWSNKALVAEPIKLPPLLNRQAFIKENDTVFEEGQFRVMDLLLDTVSTPNRLLASHYFWDSRQRCVAMRVSSIALPEPLTASASASWDVLYTTDPCIPVAATVMGEASLTNHVGGRMAWAPDGRLLFGVGDFQQTKGGRASLPQRPEAAPGKLLLIDRLGATQTLSMGHRNPEGLTVTRSGTVWETEHGPTGGDELNRIIPGGNYGWPLTSFGLDAGIQGLDDRASAGNGDFVDPTHVWVPSVGVSNLLEVEGPEFPAWNGDLLVASLAGQALFRVRLRDNKVVYAEPIRLGKRIRDLVQDASGRVVLWTDDGAIVTLVNADRASPGAAAFSGCATCHLSSSEGSGTAPDLRGVLGRRAGSSPGFVYSDALSYLALRWTEESIDAYLQSPGEFAPGTSMPNPGLSPAERAAVLDFLVDYK